MIRYSLVCDHQHDFEIWFQNSADYDKQRKRKLVNCPNCGSSVVEKALMAPNIGQLAHEHREEPASAAPTPLVPAVETAPVAVMSPQEREFRAKLRELREHLVGSAENVGKQFPEEARKMHYGESEARSIYGEATPQDARDLLEEGVELLPIPMLPDERN